MPPRTPNAESRAGAMQPERARLIHMRPQQPGPVLYWMHREMRAADNWALLHAQTLARERQQPLAVVFCLARHYSLASLMHFAFMLRPGETRASPLLFQPVSDFPPPPPPFPRARFCTSNGAGGPKTASYTYAQKGRYSPCASPTD